jgi:formamidopyrimidine-DNA glycosylase
VPLNSPQELDERLRGQTVLEVRRRAKYLVFVLDRDYLLIHLKMSGRLQVESGSSPPNPYAHVVFRLAGGDELRFHNPRKFGRVYLLDEPEVLLGALGPEPLDPAFTRGVFRELIRRRRGRLKPLLLNQTFVAGLGNIYVDESLWAARLHPLRTADTLSTREADRLHGSITQVLEAAVAARGTSFSAGGYRDLTGNPGEMQASLSVFGRTGQPCPRCGSQILKSVVAGRGTHTCPRCQREP